MSAAVHTVRDANRPATGPGSAAAAAPFPLTASHFGAALGFFVLGAFGLVLVAPDLAAGRYLMPQVVAVTHLFTLGWITTSIMGALYQLFPVVLGTSLRSPRVGYASLLLYAPGLLLFTAGMLGGGTTLTLAGAITFSSGLLLFLGNVAATMRRTRPRELTWWTLTAAFVFLGVTIVLGMSLAGNMRWAWLGADRLRALGVHMHVALGGWVLLVVIGVGRRLLPMFLLSPGGKVRMGAAAAGLVAAGAATLTLFHHAAGAWVAWSAALLLAGGTAVFLVQAGMHVRRRNRPQLDAGLRLALSGVAFLTAALPLGLSALAAGFANARLNTAYGTAAVLGAFTLFVAGHYYKILPFLVWNQRFAPLVGQGRTLPRVADLFSATVAQAVFVLLAGGAAGLTAAVLAGHAPTARAAAAFFALGAVLLLAQMTRILRTRSNP
jgi:hypothetical protein